MRTNAPDDSGPTEGELALDLVAKLERTLRDLTSPAALGDAFSRPARRRIAAAALEAEENLLDIGTMLQARVDGREPSAYACRNLINERGCEMLGSWVAATEAARARGSTREQEALRGFLAEIADALEAVARFLERDYALSLEEERRHDESRRLLAMPNLPVM